MKIKTELGLTESRVALSRRNGSTEKKGLLNVSGHVGFPEPNKAQMGASWKRRAFLRLLHSFAVMFFVFLLCYGADLRAVTFRGRCCDYAYIPTIFSTRTVGRTS